MSLRTPRCFLARRLNSNASALEGLVVGLCLHGGSIAGENACRNGCISVEEISCFSYQVAVGRTMSDSRVVEAAGSPRHFQRIQLALRRVVNPLHFVRQFLRVGALDVVHATDQVLQEVALTLSGGAEQVRTPQGQVRGQLTGLSTSSTENSRSLEFRRCAM